MKVPPVVEHELFVTACPTCGMQCEVGTVILDGMPGTHSNDVGQ